ncbi:hypothetical protein AJ80_02216 [Polytolypa hystricis UAMH7299]|uniref:Aminoglycoside phosphotransferase domain-containing protein n=1 Tax=Polytolypa hystricis (strain UAMH7299) TaxID=1447883 RepID=A0A2B7YQ33_POLH7|nr:hypothetical protein AJ80_02216 [Polytolypa hystricis UAMH7299]
MEYIAGRTAAQLLEGIEDLADKEAIYRQVAFGLGKLHRIPVPPRSRPAAVDGGMIRHSLFDDNKLLDITRLLTTRAASQSGNIIQGLSREPMVFCYSDLWLGNFIIDQHDCVTVVDFADASILPSSFSKFMLSPTQNELEYDITNWASDAKSGATAGSRILPSRTSKNDAEYQCQMDMGEEVKDNPGYCNVYLQVNSQSKSEGLKEWLRKNLHGKLATTQVNRNILEKERPEEGKRVVSELIEEAKKNL